MPLDLLADADFDPDPGEVIDEELAVTDDVLLKVFALGPDATIEPHEHPDATNVFHVVRGSVVVHREGTEEPVDAPGVVCNERGQTHGAHNDSDELAVLTAGICPFPG